ncbi:tetratricopeptide repeat (TPR)-like superfamily protein [Artemisia annua]|uniref:Tetratricopeptide repeat (TPR)-like superfamily protein n=1 Tax=Artemisia annua TaxID=35608 RepID=A0A2U1M5A0_ARTAN|nr:tetratricopeptide repeat (TPR)-like superfamily protein [Artemisia annua]
MELVFFDTLMEITGIYVCHVDGSPTSSKAERERVRQYLEAAIDRKTSQPLGPILFITGENSIWHLHNDNFCIPKKPHSILTRCRTPDKSSFSALSISSWTSFIAHYCRTGCLDQAAAEFTRMRVSGAEPNHVTFVTLLSGFADFPVHALSFGASVHGLVCKLGYDTDNVRVGTAIIDMYCKCNRVDLALLCFQKMGYKNKKGHYEHALEWFQEMQDSGVQPDFVTIVSALSTCANLGALGLGLWLHRIVLEGNMLRDNVRINNSLIDIYCGVRSKWKSAGSSQVFLFDAKRRVEPDGVTFTGALTACSHAGLVDEGLKLFDMMLKDYRISPRIEHYGCLVDLYSRASLLEEALNVIESMPMKPNEVVLGSVLGARKVAAGIRLAEKLMRFISKLNPSSDSNFVLLSNIYAAGGDWPKASKVRRRMKNRGIEKSPGISSIEIDGIVYQIVAGDQSHVKSDHICKMLDNLSHELMISGYLPEVNAREQYE